MAHLDLSFLGPFQVKLDDMLVTSFEADKVRALLAYLAVESDHPHRREQLASLFWPGWPDTSARTSLRNALSNLRKAVSDEAAEPPFLLISRETIQFNSESDYALDTREIERASKDSHATADQLQSVLDSSLGRFLEGFTLKDCPAFDDWSLVIREQLQTQVSNLLFRLGELYEKDKQYEKTIGCARKRLTLEPWQEDAHRQLMRLLSLSGQRSAALAQFETCKRSLKTELGVEPSAETVRLYESIRGGQPSEPEPAKTHPHNLPAQLSSFIGREKEIAQVQNLLSTHRLVTLTGPGGVGKSRLALQVAKEVLPAFNQGVWLVDFSSLTDPNLVAQNVVNALGWRSDANIPSEQLLVQFLPSRNLLLLLDNCERLVEACARLAAMLLQACPDLRILATSREPLGVEGEALFPLATLAFPDPNHLPLPQTLKQYEAVQLFSERAALVFPGFAVTQDNALAIAQLCQRLDGMPLALELAAARANLLSPTQIVERLDAHLWMLTTSSRAQLSRHRSLQACLDWSYALLSGAERTLLSRLAVFAGGWTLEAAEAVCTDSPGDQPPADSLEPAAILELLSQLVSKSLVTTALAVEPRPQREMRYHLLDTIRQYAYEALERSPDTVRAVRQQHCAYYLGWLAQRYPDLTGRLQVAAIREIGVESENVRAAWDWAVSQGMVELLLPAALSMYIFYSRDERTRIGEEICRVAAERLSPDILPNPAASPGGISLLILLWSMQANLSCFLGDALQAERLLQQAADLLEQAKAIGLQLIWEEAFFWNQKGAVNKVQRRNAQAQACYERALELFHGLGDRYWEAESLHSLAYISDLSSENYEETRRLQECALEIYRSLGIPGEIAIVLQELGLTACRQGHFEESERLTRESLALCQESNDRFGIALSTCRLGEALGNMGRFEEAQSLMSQGLTALEDQGSWYWARLYTNLLGETEAHLGNYDRARQLCHKNLAETHESYFLWGVQVHSRLVLGMACLGAKQPAEALAWLTEAAEEERKINAHNIQGWSLALLGTAAIQLGKMERAREYLKESLQIYDQSGFSDPLLYSLPAIAVLLIVQGETRRAVEVYSLARRFALFSNSRWFRDVFGQPLATIADLQEDAFISDVQLDLKAVVHKLLGELRSK